MSRPPGWGLSAERPRTFPRGTVAYPGSPWHRPRVPRWYEPPLMAWFAFAFVAVLKLVTEYVLIPGWDLWHSPSTGFADALAAYVLAVFASAVWVFAMVPAATAVVLAVWWAYGWATGRVVPFL